LRYVAEAEDTLDYAGDVRDTVADALEAMEARV
jgi:hypothetical protein